MASVTHASTLTNGSIKAGYQSNIKKFNGTTTLASNKINSKMNGNSVMTNNDSKTPKSFDLVGIEAKFKAACDSIENLPKNGL